LEASLACQNQLSVVLWVIESAYPGGGPPKPGGGGKGMPGGKPGGLKPGGGPAIPGGAKGMGGRCREGAPTKKTDKYPHV